MKVSRRVFSSMAIASLVPGCRRGPAGVAGVISAPPAGGGGHDVVVGGTSPQGYASLAGFCDGVPAVTEDEYAQRAQSVATALAGAGLDAIVLEPGPNMLYLAGVRWGRSERPFLCLLRADGSQAWVCPAFEERSAGERLPEGAQVLLWQEHEDPFAVAAGFVGTGAKLAVDSDARGFIYAGLRRHVAGSVVNDAPVASVRLRKTEAELARLRRANEATKAAIAAASSNLQPGMTQSAFAAELTAAQEAAGLEQVWCLALFGPAASFPHGTEDDRALGEDDVVLVDTGGGLHGYRSDVSRTWAVGSASPAFADAWNAVAEAQAAALVKIRDGAPCSAPDTAARSVIEAAGHGAGYEHFTHRLGHGIGLQVHEPPYLRPDNAEVLRPGMTMSNEPGIYVPGAFGVRIEDIVAVTAGGPDVLGPPVGPFDDPLRGHAQGR